MAHCSLFDAIAVLCCRPDAASRTARAVPTHSGMVGVWGGCVGESSSRTLEPVLSVCLLAYVLACVCGFSASTDTHTPSMHAEGQPTPGSSGTLSGAFSRCEERETDLFDEHTRCFRLRACPPACLQRVCSPHQCAANVEVVVVDGCEARSEGECGLRLACVHLCTRYHASSLRPAHTSPLTHTTPCVCCAQGQHDLQHPRPETAGPATSRHKEGQTQQLLHRLWAFLWATPCF